MRRKVAAIVRERNAGDPVIPIVQDHDIERGAVADATIADIEERGACVIRRVFAPEQAREWNDEIGRYVDGNGLTELDRRTRRRTRTLARWPRRSRRSTVSTGRARRSRHDRPNRSRAREFFSMGCGVRRAKAAVTSIRSRCRLRRSHSAVPPGSSSLGLSPHVDGGSIDAWPMKASAECIGTCFGELARGQPVRCRRRPTVREIPSSWPSVPCFFGPSRVGRRSRGRARETGHASVDPHRDGDDVPAAARVAGQCARGRFVWCATGPSVVSAPSVAFFCSTP